MASPTALGQLCHGDLNTVPGIRGVRKHLLERIKSSEQDSTLFGVGEWVGFTSPFTGSGVAA